MRVLIVKVICVAVIFAQPLNQNIKSSAAEPQDPDKNAGVTKGEEESSDHTDVNKADEVPSVSHKADGDKTDSSVSDSSSGSGEHCANLMATLLSSGITQTCTVHDDCRGACCAAVLLAHNIAYNFTVLPCDKPTVILDFNISDIDGARINNNVTESGKFVIPNGNMSYQGWNETASSLEVVLDKVLDITHFRLDFGVQYKVLASDPVKDLFSHTLVPMLSVEYSEDLCKKPTVLEGEEEDGKYFGVIPKEYVKDKKNLALITTSAALVIIVLIVAIYCIISKKRGNDQFYRTYVSTDENRHLTKGNDGFEPLDDSDID